MMVASRFLIEGFFIIYIFIFSNHISCSEYNFSHHTRDSNKSKEPNYQLPKHDNNKHIGRNNDINHQTEPIKQKQMQNHGEENQEEVNSSQRLGHKDERVQQQPQQQRYQQEKQSNQQEKQSDQQEKQSDQQEKKRDQYEKEVRQVRRQRHRPSSDNQVLEDRTLEEVQSHQQVSTQFDQQYKQLPQQQQQQQQQHGKERQYRPHRHHHHHQEQIERKECGKEWQQQQQHYFTEEQCQKLQALVDYNIHQGLNNYFQEYQQQTRLLPEKCQQHGYDYENHLQQIIKNYQTLWDAKTSQQPQQQQQQPGIERQYRQQWHHHHQQEQFEQQEYEHEWQQEQQQQQQQEDFTEERCQQLQAVVDNNLHKKWNHLFQEHQQQTRLLPEKCQQQPYDYENHFQQIIKSYQTLWDAKHQSHNKSDNAIDELSQECLQRAKSELGSSSNFITDKKGSVLGIEVNTTISSLDSGEYKVSYINNTDQCCTTIEKFISNSSLQDVFGKQHRIAQFEDIGSFQFIRHGICGRKVHCKGKCVQTYINMNLLVQPTDKEVAPSFKFFPIPGYCVCKNFGNK